MILARELRFTTTILALLLGSLVLPGVATAAPGDRCTAAAGAGLKISDPAGAGATYATHELSVTSQSTDPNASFDSRTAAAPGARRVDDPEGSDGLDGPVFVRDTPGPLTVTGAIETVDQSLPSADKSCTAYVSKTVTLLPALAPLFSLKRPRKGKDGRGALIYEPNPPFTITVKHRTGSNRTPITVRARVRRGHRLPTKRTKARLQVFAQRASDYVDPGDSARGCTSLVCPRKTKQGGHRKSVEIYASQIEGKPFTKGVRVRLTSPNGYPPPYRPGPQQRNVKTPFGADIELLQSGRRIARLRIVANCDGYGQSAKCRFRKISTKR